MKRIEAIIKTEAFPEIRSALESIGIYSLSKHDITGGTVVSRDGAIGKGGGQGVFLSKIELIAGDKEAHKVIDLIGKLAGGGKEEGKIFVSNLDEIIDARTLEGKKELEGMDELLSDTKSKRSRLVPLQKYTMMRAEKFYSIHRDSLRSEYRIRSFSDFINFCVLGYLPIIEGEIKRGAIEMRKPF